MHVYIYFDHQSLLLEVTAQWTDVVQCLVPMLGPADVWPQQLWHGAHRLLFRLEWSHLINLMRRSWPRWFYILIKSKRFVVPATVDAYVAEYSCSYWLISHMDVITDRRYIVGVRYSVYANDVCNYFAWHNKWERLVAICANLHDNVICQGVIW